MILYGVLSVYDRFDNLIQTINEITKNDIKQENKKVNWNKTMVFDNSNSGRYQNLIIHRERYV